MKKQIQYIPVVLTLCILFIAQGSPAWGLDPVFEDFWGQAIRGYDPVAYFKEGKPVKGLKKYQHEWNEAKWHFSSQQNRDDFIRSPESYAPQYGGYCAWAVSQGYTASIDPEAWNIYEGKLYLNYSKDVQETWSKDIPGNIQKADKNWPKLLVE
jgi:hypothetical protein